MTADQWLVTIAPMNDQRQQIEVAMEILTRAVVVAQAAPPQGGSTVHNVRQRNLEYEASLQIVENIVAAHLEKAKPEKKGKPPEEKREATEPKQAAPQEAKGEPVNEQGQPSA